MLRGMQGVRNTLFTPLLFHKGAAGAHAHRAHDKGKAFKGPGWMKEKEKRTGEASGEGESGSSARAARDRRGKSGRKGGRVQGAWA